MKTTILIIILLFSTATYASEKYTFTGKACEYYVELSKDRALTPSRTLTERAQKRADEMVVFSHKGYRKYFTNSGYNFIAENLFVGKGNAQEIEALFMASPTHKANIVNKNYTDVGIAVRHLTTPIVDENGEKVSGDIVVVLFGGKLK